MGRVMNSINEKIDERIHAYTEILEVIKKHEKTLNPQYNTRVPDPDDLSTVIRMLNVSKKFGIPISEDSPSEWMNVISPDGKRYRYDFMNLGFFHGVSPISWSDDGRQPDNEWLFRICFPTGAYIFGDGDYFNKEYPVETFNAFFEELKSYGPKYCATANNSLYFSSDNAKRVYEDFDEIFNRHKAGVVNEMKKQKKLQLEQELERLNRDLSMEAQ
jgi:hypothetical protein